MRLSAFTPAPWRKTTKQRVNSQDNTKQDNNNLYIVFGDKRFAFYSVILRNKNRLVAQKKLRKA
jgi:hypothetical protein